MSQCVLDLVFLCRVVPQHPVFEFRDPFQKILKWFAICLTVKGWDRFSMNHNAFTTWLLTETMFPVKAVGGVGDFLPRSLQLLCPAHTDAQAVLSVRVHLPVVLPQPNCDRLGKS